MSYTPFNPYNPYASMNYGYQPQAPQPAPQQPAPNGNGILWVQGEAGAKSYLVGAGQSVMLMDSESNTFYIKSSDVSGMPHPIRIFDYVERTPNQAQPQAGVPQSSAVETGMPYATKEQVEVLYKRIEELERMLTAQTQSPTPDGGK